MALGFAMVDSAGEGLEGAEGFVQVGFVSKSLIIHPHISLTHLPGIFPDDIRSRDETKHEGMGKTQGGAGYAKYTAAALLYSCVFLVARSLVPRGLRRGYHFSRIVCFVKASAPIIL